MTALLPRLGELFAIGVATPLSAVCVIPLYPAFIAYLANSTPDADATPGDTTGTADGPSPLLLGVAVLAGVLSFMGLLGLVFTMVLGESLTTVVGVVSPVAFAVMIGIGLLLVADAEVFSRVPSVEPPQFSYPSLTAFSYGFFFGAIVIPCNPGTIALFFARAPVLFDTHLQSMLGFLAFGLGIGTPLLVIAVLSESLGRRLTRTIARYRTWINRATGTVLLVVGVYYLVDVFEVLGTV